MSTFGECTGINFILKNGIQTYDQLRNQNNNLKFLVMKMKNRTASRNELMDAIYYELFLLDDCKTTMDNELKELEKEKLDEVTSRNAKIINWHTTHINKLFKNIFKQFSIYPESLLKYLEFCMSNKIFFTECKKTLNRFASTYYEEPEVYIIAAMFVFEELCDIEKARKYFAEGLKHHKNIKLLYIEQFWMEISHVERTACYSYKNIIENYKKLINHFQGDMILHFQLLNMATMRPRVTELLCIIVRDIVDKYKENKYLWKTMADITLKGFIYDYKIKILYYSNNDYCKIKHVIKTYTRGLKKMLSPENKRQLLTLYVDDLNKIQNSHYMQGKKISALIENTIERVFQDAHDNKALSCVCYYSNRARYTKNLGDFLNSISLISNKLVMWKFKFIRYMEYDIDNTLIQEAFLYCIPLIRRKQFSLWNIIEKYMKHQNLNLLNVLHKYTDSSNLDEEYIVNWRNLTYRSEYIGINETLQFTKEVRHTYPELEDSYKETKKLLGQLKSCRIAIMTIFSELLCFEFGYNNIQLWTDYIKITYEFCKNEGARAKSIYNTSLLYINPELIFSMTKNFNELQNQYRNISLID